MQKYMERKVGETFEYEGHTLKVEKSSICSDCYFNDNQYNLKKKFGECIRNYRADNNNVIFKKVK